MPAEQLLRPFASDRWEPIALAGDYVRLLKQSDEQILRLDSIYSTGMLGEVDFGVVADSASSAISAALINTVDILEVGPREFLQIRFQLSPDFAGVLPGADASVSVFQPGPANQRLTTLTQVGVVDITLQNLWTSLNTTEMFSHANQTPQFVVTNNTGGSLANTRVRFYAWRYLADQVFENGKEPETAAVLSSPAGRIISIPVVPRQGRTTPAIPAT